MMFFIINYYYYYYIIYYITILGFSQRQQYAYLYTAENGNKAMRNRLSPNVCECFSCDIFIISVIGNTTVTDHSQILVVFLKSSRV